MAVEVRSPKGFKTIYGHLSAAIDKEMSVTSGTEIGKMGASGWVMGENP